MMVIRWPVTQRIAPVPNAPADRLAKHEWAPFLKEDAIACAWAIRSDNLDAYHFQDLLQRGGGGQKLAHRFAQGRFGQLTGVTEPLTPDPQSVQHHVRGVLAGLADRLAQ